MSAGDVLLELRHVHASYGAVEVLRGIDLKVREGEIVALLGTNGAGKSTILRCVSGLMKVDAGSITMDGHELTGLTTEETVRLGITQVPGGRGLLPNLSVEENLRMGAYPVRKDRAAVKAGYERVYDTFPRLGERRKQLAGLMSGGEQQMLAIGRALMSRPRLLLLDEPSMGLAPIMVERIFEVIRTISSEGVTMLLVEQNARLALESSHRGYVLEGGVVSVSGKAESLLHDPRIREAYLGE